MAKQQRKSPEQYESETTKFVQGSNVLGKLVTSAMKYGFLGYMVFCLKESFVAFAGHQTTANIGITLLADLKLPQWFGYVFGGSGIGYGLGERYVRRKSIKRLSSRNNELERMINQDKASSMLTEYGTTGD